MKSKSKFCFIVFAVLNAGWQYAAAQENFYIPINIKKAYEKETRSLDGSPGINYWQNSSKYKIKVSINPGEKLVSGAEEIEYTNNSPDTLKEIVIRLYQNVYKPGSPRDFEIAPEDLTDGVSISKFIYNKIEVPTRENTKFTINATNLFFDPDNPVLPHSKVNLKFEWNFKMSARHMRMGIYDSTSFFIGYWYPQISVYDDIDGWDKIEYTGAQEFYNDYSDYEVEVSVPNKFAVWGTGILENPEKIFTGEFFNRYREAHKSGQVAKIISADDLNSKKIFNDAEEFNTWIFKAENVTDFSFALSDHYLWDALNINVSNKPVKNVFISAVYKKESSDFYDVAAIAEKS
ncbi:MAG TPA: hypothetical protein VMT35_09760, partial [Ignavibacteriaceae bacterium]|nr:hypothetical protein [Ignavibacteriaceae bacterium]